MAYDEKLIDTKLELVEARTDMKFAQLLGKLDVLAVNVSAIGGQIAGVKADVAGVKADTATVKANIIATGLVLDGLIIAVVAFGYQILDLAQGLFSAGAASK